MIMVAMIVVAVVTTTIVAMVSMIVVAMDMIWLPGCRSTFRCWIIWLVRRVHPRLAPTWVEILSSVACHGVQIISRWWDVKNTIILRLGAWQAKWSQNTLRCGSVGGFDMQTLLILNNKFVHETFWPFLFFFKHFFIIISQYLNMKRRKSKFLHTTAYCVMLILDPVEMYQWIKI
jgi:hypothetical protein